MEKANPSKGDPSWIAPVVDAGLSPEISPAESGIEKPTSKSLT
jgi:hypothetical protein